MSHEYSAYIDDPTIPVEQFTTHYVYTKRAKGLPEEVNGVSKYVFTPHHILFLDERDILICAYPADDVINIEQSVAA